MSDTGTTTTEADPTQQQPTESENIANLREAASRGVAATQRADALEREIAFLRAGVDDQSPIGKLFVKSYEGELTVEAITAAAGEVGALKSTTPPVRETTEEEAAQQSIRDRLADANAGVSTTDPEARDAVADAMTWFQDNKAALGEDNARVDAIAQVISKAAQGDKTAIFDEAAWERRQAEYPSDPYKGTSVRESTRK